MVGEVALVAGGGQGVGRAVALALAARGVDVVVAGADERALGRVVGEITCGGAKARHIAGDASDPAYLRAAVAKAVETFGKLTFVVATSGEVVEMAELIGVAKAHLAPHARLLPVVALPSGSSPGTDGLRAALTAQVSLWASDLPSTAPGATCNAVVCLVSSPEADFDAAAEVALFFCSELADGINGQALTMTA
jgi:hypothetical protein